MEYFIEPKTRKSVKRYGFLSFARNFSNKYRKQLLNTWPNALKTASKKVINKSVETTGEFIGNKIGDKIVKQKPVIDKISRNIAEIIIPPEKREEILNESRQVL